MTEALKSVWNPVTQKKIRVSPSTSSGEVPVVDNTSTLIPLEAAAGIAGADATHIWHSHSNRRVFGVAEQDTRLLLCLLIHWFQDDRSRHQTEYFF
ncbi:Sodium/hydrogen exchanger 2 [Zea mays]|jgi:hypothetical protein|uniref:Sodium/hydrogen exchanger 2 n=1 Tax=Zea mays TaxID=4577 RepID=A0A1D6JUU6_MAIZE|nr:Sodium/hydrogen exchanger 2 [Zea mays]